MAKFTTHKKIALVFIAPQLIITLLFFIWPSCLAVFQSFHWSDAFGINSQFSGWSNFFDLWRDPSFLHACWMTVLLASAISLLTMSLGLFLAYIVHHVRGQKIYKTLLIWPYAVAPAIAAILWRFLCQPALGWLARFSQYCGWDFNYLVHPGQAIGIIVIAASWQQLSYNFLFYLAAVKSIPQSIIDAAILDGASKREILLHILLPLLSPTTFFLFVMNFLYGCFETFGIIDILTGGGPGATTNTLIYKIYKDGFIGMDPGSSSTQSFLLMMLVVALTALQFYFLEKRVHYK